jgi:hypothetical protein
MGADPKIKDIFYEADFATISTTIPSSPQLYKADFIKKVSADYFESNVDLNHINVLPGINEVRLHFDMKGQGFDPSGKGLYGDWGGGSFHTEAVGSTLNIVITNDYREEKLKNFLRHIFFRHAIFFDNFRGGLVTANCRLGLARINRDETGELFGNFVYYSGGRSMAISYEEALAGFAFGSGNCVRVFAHELGHNLGLGHGGPAQNGDFNTKPNYPSVMSYTFTEHTNQKFYIQPPKIDPNHTTSNLNLNPSNVFEALGLGWNISGSLFTGGGFDAWKINLTYPVNVVGDRIHIDWNRNGQIDNTTNNPSKGLRAPILLAEGNETEVGSHLSQRLDRNLTSSLRTPKLLAMQVQYKSSIRHRMFAFHTRFVPVPNRAPSERIHFSFADFVPIPNNTSSCIGGDKLQHIDKSQMPWVGKANETCLNWMQETGEVPRQLGNTPAGIEARAVTALAVETPVTGFDNQLIIAYVTPNNELAITWTDNMASISSSDSPAMSGTTLTIPGVSVVGEPELVVSNVNNNQPSSISVIFASATSGTNTVLKADIQYNNSNNSWSLSAPYQLYDQSWNPLQVSIAPTIIRFPDYSDSSQLCGIFPEATGGDGSFPIRMYCHIKGTGSLWQDFTHKLKKSPRTNAKVGFAYRYYRYKDGSLLNPTSLDGRLWVITRITGNFNQYEDGDNRFQTFISKTLNKNTPVSSSTFEFLDFSSEYHVFSRPLGASGISLASDKRVAALQGLSFYQGTSNELWFLPFADGTVNGNLISDGDFKVMSGAICRSIRDAFYCGSLMNNPWGY